MAAVWSCGHQCLCSDLTDAGVEVGRSVQTNLQFCSTVRDLLAVDNTIMKQRAAIYTRPCGSTGPSADQQEAEARGAAELLTAEVIGVWREDTLSPRQRRNGLPVRSLMLTRLQGQADCLIVSDVIALGRSVNDLVLIMAELETLGIDLLVNPEPGEHPRRVDSRLLDAARRRYDKQAAVEGRERAARHGVKMGRPVLPPERIIQARAALAAGFGVRAAARAAGIGVASAFRLKEAGQFEQERQDLINWPRARR